jgi:hypothetical protein
MAPSGPSSDLLSAARPARFTVGLANMIPLNLGYAEDPQSECVGRRYLHHRQQQSRPLVRNDGSRPCWIGPKLSHPDKYALIEYRKAVRYEDYPSDKRAQMLIMPCQGGKIDWARKY